MTLHPLEQELSLPIHASLPPAPSSSSSTTSPSSSPHLVTKTNNHPSSSSSVVTIPLTPSTSIRSSPKCLLIGRQLSTADIRIDHGSISRKHAVLFFLPKTNGTGGTTTSSGSETKVMMELVLQDLGGKHGCCINGTKLNKKDRCRLMDGDEIQFGNVRERIFVVRYPQPWVVVVPTSDGSSGNGTTTTVMEKEEKEKEDDGTKDHHGTVDQTMEDSNNDTEQTNRGIANNQNNNNNNNVPDFSHLTGRARREAELAASMDFFDKPVTYTKWIDPDQDQDADPSHPQSLNNQHNSSNNNNNTTTATRQPSVESTTITSRYKLPLTSTLTLPYTPNPTTTTITSSSSSTTPTSTITSLTIDPSGSRLITTSTDATLRLYDFGGLSLSDLTPFKLVTIDSESDGGRHPLIQATFSPSGNRLMVGSAAATPCVLDREGRSVWEFVKGDPYVVDMAVTNGHVACVTGVVWHPLEEDVVGSCSVDGSVRVWDVGRKDLDGSGSAGRQQKTLFGKLCARTGGGNCIRAKDMGGRRVSVTSAVYAPGGRELAIGTGCGSVQIWKVGGGGSGGRIFGNRPDRVRYRAHGIGGTSGGGGGGEGTGASVHSLVYSPNGKCLASRCMGEESVRVWEARKLRKDSLPVAICAGARSLDEFSNSAFSPDGRLLCVGTSVRPLRSKRKGEVFIQEYGMLKIYEIDMSYRGEDDVVTPSRPILEMDVALGVSVVSVVWHAKLNQIFLGLSDGSVKICYDKTYSKKGALSCIAKGIKPVDELSLLLASRVPLNCSANVTGPIKTPHALPLFRDADDAKKANDKRKHKRDREEEEDMRTRKPRPPATGIKMGEGTSARLNFQQFVVSSTKMLQNQNIAGKDPRAELFKYSVGKKGDRMSKYDTGPRVLAEKTVEEEEEEMEGK